MRNMKNDVLIYSQKIYNVVKPSYIQRHSILPTKVVTDRHNVVSQSQLKVKKKSRVTNRWKSALRQNAIGSILALRLLRNT